jgi:hypothetical protein
MTREEMVDVLGLDDETLFMDGFDDCVIGVCEQFGRPPVIAYNKKKVIRKLGGGEGAEELWSFNQLGAWMGEYTPVFVTKVPR